MHDNRERREDTALHGKSSCFLFPVSCSLSSSTVTVTASLAGWLRGAWPARHGRGVEVRLSTPLSRADWQRLRTILVAGVDTAALQRGDHHWAPASEGSQDASCGAGYPGAAGRFGQGQLAVSGGVSQMVDLGAEDALLRSGRWWTLRIQLLPDGRCGIAINGRVVWRSPESIPVNADYRLRLGDESAGALLLHGPLQVWTGVRTDIDWAKAGTGTRR